MTVNMIIQQRKTKQRRSALAPLELYSATSLSLLVMPIVSIQRSFAYLTSTNSCSKYGHHHPRIGITQVATKVSSEHSRPHVRLAARVKNDGLCVEEFSLSRRWTAILASIGIGSVAGLRRSVDAADGTRKSALKQQVEKSPLDRRTYKALSLSNGLRVLIVSDPEADSAAAAMDVHVGYFNDPDDLPGLAHFCEHMLFLGTKAFPDENSFNKFLTENGGGSNAFTDNEDTCFFFNCGVDALEGALERFASFFTGPLFTESATAREVNAINSEHLKNLQMTASGSIRCKVAAQILLILSTILALVLHRRSQGPLHQTVQNCAGNFLLIIIVGTMRLS